MSKLYITREYSGLEVTSMPNLSRKTLKCVQFNPPIHPWKLQVWPNIFCCCKTYVGTIRNRITAKGLPTIPWSFYSTKMWNITIKITKFFTSFHRWHSKLLHCSVRHSFQIMFQEGLIGMRKFYQMAAYR